MVGSSKSTSFLTTQPPTSTPGWPPRRRSPPAPRADRQDHEHDYRDSHTGCRSARVIAAAVIAATNPTRCAVERVRA